MNRYSVCVIMSTYNGERYVEEQIKSILEQSIENVSVFVRDDGSKDRTVSILEKYPNVKVIQGKNMGAKQSFMEAIMLAPVAEFYAFSDQDDVWDKDKLETAISQIAQQMSVNKDHPILYTSTTRLVDEELRIIQDGVDGAKWEASFYNGLIPTPAGCTMVWNAALMTQLKKYKPQHYAMHDSWVMWLNQAIGGLLIHDSNPHISYRQHSNNVVGGTRGIIGSIRRRIRFHAKSEPNYKKKMLQEILENYWDVMPKEHVKRCEFVCQYDQSVCNTCALLLDKRFFRGKWHRAIDLYLQVLLRRY